MEWIFRRHRLALTAPGFLLERGYISGLSEPFEGLEVFGNLHTE